MCDKETEIQDWLNEKVPVGIGFAHKESFEGAFWTEFTRPLHGSCSGGSTSMAGEKQHLLYEEGVVGAMNGLYREDRRDFLLRQLNRLQFTSSVKNVNGL